MKSGSTSRWRGRKLSDYRLEEGQSGDQVHFLLKELPHIGVHVTWHRETRVTVESPAQLTLQAKTSAGNVTLSGLQGDLNLTTGDGNLTLDHVSGSLRIKSGDGHVRVTDAEWCNRGPHQRRNPQRRRPFPRACASHQRRYSRSQLTRGNQAHWRLNHSIV